MGHHCGLTHGTHEMERQRQWRDRATKSLSGLRRCLCRDTRGPEWFPPPQWAKVAVLLRHNAWRACICNVIIRKDYFSICHIMVFPRDLYGLWVSPPFRKGLIQYEDNKEWAIGVELMNNGLIWAVASLMMTDEDWCLCYVFVFCLQVHEIVRFTRFKLEI